ncbi:MAG: hypothetical protein Q4B99_03590 [Clostridia bacterium]|nr:hypothetical protein [Clostridia bacterium]
MFNLFLCKSLMLAAMNLEFSPGTLLESLLLLAKGMVGIFVVIAVVILLVYLLNKVFKGDAAAKE